MRKFDLLVTIACIITIVFIWIKPVEIDMTLVPEAMNGISAVTSVIIGFIGVIFAIASSKKMLESESLKKRTTVTMLMLSLSITLVYSSYFDLIFYAPERAVRWSMSGMAIAVFVFVSFSVLLLPRLFRK